MLYDNEYNLIGIKDEYFIISYANYQLVINIGSLSIFLIF
jgi:hypothetical protein